MEWNDFNNWNSAVTAVRKKNYKVILPLISPEQFREFLIENLIPKLLNLRDRHFSVIEVIQEVIQDGEELNFLFVSNEYPK